MSINIQLQSDTEKSLWSSLQHTYIISLIQEKNNASPCKCFTLAVKRIFEISVNKKIKSRYRFIFFTRAKFSGNLFTKKQN